MTPKKPKKKLRKGEQVNSYINYEENRAFHGDDMTPDKTLKTAEQMNAANHSMGSHNFTPTPPAPEGMRSAEEWRDMYIKDGMSLSELIDAVQQNAIASQSEKLRKMRDIIQKLNDKRIDTTGSEPPKTLVETFWLNQLVALSDGE